MAYVKHTTARENTDGRNEADWARNRRSDDYELLCNDGTRSNIDDWADCNMGSLPSNAVVTAGQFQCLFSTQHHSLEDMLWFCNFYRLQDADGARYFLDPPQLRSAVFLLGHVSFHFHVYKHQCCSWCCGDVTMHVLVAATTTSQCSSRCSTTVTSSSKTRPCVSCESRLKSRTTKPTSKQTSCAPWSAWRTLTR